MRPNPTNYVGYGTCGQAALFQKKCSLGGHVKTSEKWGQRYEHKNVSTWGKRYEHKNVSTWGIRYEHKNVSTWGKRYDVRIRQHRVSAVGQLFLKTNLDICWK